MQHPEESTGDAVILKLGSKGSEVEALQRGLVSIGLLKGSVDGDFGPKTESALKKFQRAASLLPDGVYGPVTAERLRLSVPAEMPETQASEFIDGWWGQAIRCPVWPSRVGREIDPYITVVHTTDMFPGTMPALLKSWATSPGKGNAAHFLIGRFPNAAADKDYPNGGVVQMIPITHNGNHAGGGGNFSINRGYSATEGKLISYVHPNVASIGIEIDCAGRLGKPRNGKFYYPGSQRPIPDEDVFVDAKGAGWHKVTAYQYEQLDLLLYALQASYREPPGIIGIVPKGTYAGNGVPWGEMVGQIVGHVSLNPTDKTDPTPPVMDWLRQRARR